MSGMKRFFEKLKLSFVTREEAEGILNKKEKVLIGIQIGDLNSVGDDRLLNDANITGLSSFLRNGGKVKHIEIFDSEGILGISAVVIDGQPKTCCSRCGYVTSIDSGNIHIRVTKAMGAPVRAVVHGEIVE